MATQTRNGGFAEYLLADPNYIAHIPQGLGPKQAAPVICAGITAYKGIKETEARPGEWIAISGCGGLGHMAIQYAKAMGLHVCAVDIDDGKLALAKSLGADLVVNANTGNPAAVLQKAIGGGAHGVLITAPSLPAFKQGIEMMRKRGSSVLVGLPPGEFPTPTNRHGAKLSGFHAGEDTYPKLSEQECRRNVVGHRNADRRRSLGCRWLQPFAAVGEHARRNNAHDSPRDEYSSVIFPLK